jgi:hypothetical protein
MRTAVLISIAMYAFVFSPHLMAEKTESAGTAPSFQFRGIAEAGFLAVLSHQVQFGKDGTDFDYVADGGQDVLFPVTRFSVEMDVGSRNTFILLYQPLRIESQAFLEKDAVFDGLTFSGSTGINCLYSFPFYRASYLREFLPDSRRYKFAAGLSLQIRNALISFESTDGTRYRTNGGIGLVPAFKLRSKANLDKRFYIELEADGIYAPVSYLNGSTNEIVGAILDAGLRIGAKVREPGTVFVGVRYLGGGATGTSTQDVWPGDGYVRNWLHFLIVSTGYILDF